MKNIVNNIKNIGYLKDNMFAFEYDREAFREQVEKESLKLNIPIEQISKITKLSIEEIEKL